MVCLAAWGRQVGVDAERARRSDSMLAVVDRCFDAKEAAALRALPLPQQGLRFLQHWTLKEAYAKAVGMGIALGFKRVGFELGDDPAGPIAVRFAPELHDSPERWEFQFHQISDEHLVASAVERRSSADPHGVRYHHGS